MTGPSGDAHGLAHDRLPIWFQRAESAAIAVLSAVVFVELDFTWWWLIALFLVFDVSMLGYLRDHPLGAWTYNAVHNYIGPAAAAVVGVVTDGRPALFLALCGGSTSPSTGCSATA